MRYFIVPEPVTIEALSEKGGPRDPDDPEAGPALVYTFAQFHREHVWPSEVWRSGSGDNADHFDSIYSKISKAKPGDVIELTDPEYEVYAPIATMRGAKLNPQVAVEFNQLMRPILRATTKRPEAPKQATAAMPPAPEAEAPSN